MIDYSKDSKTALEAKFDAQKIAFGPVVFHAAVSLRDFGILDVLYKNRKDGMTAEDISAAVNVSQYGVRVLLEIGLSAGMLCKSEDKYEITKTGYFLLKDDLTRVNMNFVKDVCYEGMPQLHESIKDGYPAGLKVFGEFETIYQALSTLPEQAKKSWFEFDHYYSDISFIETLPLVLDGKVKHIVDIGGNTGKWAIQCAKYDPEVKVTIIDLPGQLEMAKKNIESEGLQDRISLQSANVLHDDFILPEDTDAVWMSQFLDCFSEQEITNILRRINNTMGADASVYIMELFWNRQRFEAAAFSLHNTSLYFTVFANGNSRMYHSDDLLSCVEAAGLSVASEHDEIGDFHTLWCCKAV